MPELLAVGHSKGGASLLWGAVHEPGMYPRIWCFEPIVVPVQGADARRADNPLSAGARRRRAQWPSRADAIASYGSKPPLNLLHPDALEAYVDYGMRDLPDGTVELKCRPEDEATMYMMGASLGLLPGPRPGRRARCWSRAARTTTSITPEFAAAIVDRLPHATLEVWGDRGHFGPLEDPEQAVASMLRFAGESTAD